VLKIGPTEQPFRHKKPLHCIMGIEGSRTKSFTHEYAARPTNIDRIKSFEWPTCNNV
jgi:hypothetical protein